MEFYAQTIMSVILMSLLSTLVYTNLDDWIGSNIKRSKFLTGVLVVGSVGSTIGLSTLALLMTFKALHLLILNGSGG